MTLETINSLRNEIIRNASNYSAWVSFASILLTSRNIDGLNELLTYRHSLGLSGIELAWDVCLKDLTSSTDSTSVEFAADNIGENNGFSGAFLVAKGYSKLRHYELDDGVDLIREGHRRLAILREIHNHESLNPGAMGKIALEAFLFEKADWSPPRHDHATDYKIGNIIKSQNSEQALSCCAFADSSYFLDYAERFIVSIRKNLSSDCNVIFGIINPDATALALATHLGEKHKCSILAVSYNGQYLPEFSASARFILANTILEMANETVIFFDIDSSFPLGTDRIIRKIISYPLACIETNLLPPQLQIDASVVVAQPCPATRRFFDVAAQYLTTKLQETGPLWTFDQVALHRAVAFARANGDQVSSLNEALGDNLLPRLFKDDHKTTLSKRYSQRSNSRVSFLGLDTELRPVWSRKEN